MSGPDPSDLRRIEKVSVILQAELGRTTMRFRDIERLGPGSVVTLERLAGEPVELRCRGRVIARGEVVIQDDAFAVRVIDVAGGRDADDEAKRRKIRRRHRDN